MPVPIDKGWQESKEGDEVVVRKTRKQAINNGLQAASPSMDSQALPAASFFAARASALRAFSALMCAKA